MLCSLVVLRDVFVIVIHEEVMLYVERRLMPCHEVSTCDSRPSSVEVGFGDY